ncbi:MAG TPA: helix-hairpin-helix domain-containing protein [Candidatus Atribacteria bacterium]|nr:helix-hairpin-helix domain-containing protein [Candidatus Atribacteria bacterium]
MFHLDRIQQRLFIAMALIIAVLSGILIYDNNLAGPDIRPVADPTGSPEPSVSVTAQPNDSVISIIKVYITGAVRHPGVITLEEGDRLADAIELAGGALPDADLDRVNLAQRVRDEGMYHIPKVGEEATPIVTEHPGAGGNNGTGSGSGKVNINTADQKTLETLPGIGPVKARNIIKYREENGPFKSIEEIMNVSGIGEKTFEGLKDMICTS